MPNITHSCPNCDEDVEFTVTLGKPSFSILEQDSPDEVEPLECPHCSVEFEDDVLDTVIEKAEDKERED